MKAREIILLILFIAAGVFFTHVQTGKIDFRIDDEDFFFFADEFTYQESKEVEPPLPSQVQVINARGSVEISGTSEGRIAIRLEKKIWRREEQEARRVADELKIIIRQEPERIVISTSRDEFRRRNFQTHFKISLPPGTDVDVRNSFGVVKISDVGKANISNRHGEIIASDMRELSAENSFADVEIKNVESDCNLESKHSSVFVSRVKGKTEVSNSHGEIRLDDIGQDVRIMGSHTEIFGRNLPGPVEVNNSYEKVTLINVGPTKIRTRHSRVEVEGAREYLDVEDNYGKIKADSIQGNLLIKGKNLEIYAKNIVGQEITVSSSYRNIELSQFSGKTAVFLSHGNLFLKPSPLTHPIEIKGQYADINLYWPGKGKYPFEATVKNGEIKWGLPVELSSQEENRFSTIKAFIEEKGNPSIFLSTTYGTIRIEE